MKKSNKGFGIFYLLISQKGINTTIYLWNILNNAFTQYIYEFNEYELKFYDKQINEIRKILEKLYKEITENEKDYL